MSNEMNKTIDYTVILECITASLITKLHSIQTLVLNNQEL